MKKFVLLSMACASALTLLGCDDSKSSAPQPVAGNESPKYGTTTKGGKVGKILGGGSSNVPKNVSDKTSIEP